MKHSIKIENNKFRLIYNDHARFRFGQFGGNLNALLSIPGQDYYQTILLIWAGLDEAGRKRFPAPSLLVDHIPYSIHDDSATAIDWPEAISKNIIEPAFQAVADAGWLKLADQ